MGILIQQNTDAHDRGGGAHAGMQDILNKSADGIVTREQLQQIFQNNKNIIQTKQKMDFNRLLSTRTLSNPHTPPCSQFLPSVSGSWYACKLKQYVND